MTDIFKAYDIRGIYPTQLDEETAYRIGRAFVTFLKCKEVVIGYDMRESQKKITDALIKGITDQEADIINIGLASTPMLYFAAKDKEAAIMITASHNTGEYNGFKLCKKNAIPISGDTGIKDIKKLFQENNFQEANKKGQIKELDIEQDFIEHNLRFLKQQKNNLKIVFDFGNGMGGFSYPKVFDKIECKKIYMYDKPDGSFPHHTPDPLKLENVKDLQKKVIYEKADLGVSVDGDCDRCMFIDEKGEYISADLITALLAEELLKTHPNSKILYDLRSSKSVKEIIEENQGDAIMCRVGHAFIKQQMRQEDALFAGELSGHFYYKESFFTESSIISVINIMNLMQEEGKTLSNLIKPIKRYFASGEINSEVEDKDARMKELEEKYKETAKNIFWLDGISIVFEDWWFNVRKSNTEPKLRLNLEAKNKELMQDKRDEVLGIIRK